MTVLSYSYCFVFKAFHKSCFKCGLCTKGLDSFNVTEGPDKDIYCKGAWSTVTSLCRCVCSYVTAGRAAVGSV